MKTAYELAMERLGQGGAPSKLTDEQKARIAEVEQKYKAKIAERRVALVDLIKRARAIADFPEIGQLESQFADEVKSLNEKCEAEKEKVRQENS